MKLLYELNDSDYKLEKQGLVLLMIFVVVFTDNFSTVILIKSVCFILFTRMIMKMNLL